ncbi:hypothetical protein BKA70DRAFT_1526826 [Coprinopsis sp. MPI-PUGE-AT-0042]|nr:hypothetical protein BKA70DRAFT_1526826 [Coprinopsis sp. MPI-PUGE-AT-0042]
MEGFFRNKKLPPRSDLENNTHLASGTDEEHLGGPAEGHSSNKENRDADGVDEETQPGNYDFQPDAKIWSLYLKDANDQAKAQTELWKTGLESLLLFAGLFAGVVSAFVIESRKKLRMDDQELLLHSIHNALRGLPPPENDYRPTTDYLWINGLWSSSLVITLFSAIVGVLAKSWLINYAPLTVSDKSDDAYQRWMVDRRAKTWKMDRVFTTIPLLVQLAFFLFVFGFAIQCYNDHQALGCMVYGIVGFGTIIYLTVSSVPLLIPDGSFPFQTPLSEILLQLRAISVLLWTATFGTQQHIDGAKKEDTHRVLATICSYYLTNSPTQDHADEVADEAVRTPLADGLLRLCADSGAPRISLKRLESFRGSNNQEDPRLIRIVSNHLLVISQFIQYSDRHNHGHHQLMSTLRGALYVGGPLSHWKFLPEPLLPLAFSIRVPLLLLFNEDISPAEVAEQPWGQLAQNLTPKHRLHFFVSSCRALASGGENLRRVSSLSIASRMALTMKAVFKSEWRCEPDQKRAALDLVRSCIIRVCNAIARSWKAEALEYWRASLLELEHGAHSSGYPQSLHAALKHPKTIYRRQAVSIILSMAEADPQAEIVHAVWPNLIQRAVSDDSGEVRTHAINALRIMAKKGIVPFYRFS